MGIQLLAHQGKVLVPTKAEKKEFGRFTLAGGIATLTDYGILNLLTSVFGWPLIASNIVSASVSSCISYVLNRKLVFKDKAHDSERRTFLIYILTVAVGILVIQSGVLWLVGKPIEGFVHQLLGSGTMADIIAVNAAKVTAGFGTLAWNFLVQRKLVFESHAPGRN